MLEVKVRATAKHQPNQDYHVEQLNKMSYAAFVYPENKEDVLNELERSFKVKGKTRSAKSKQSVVSE